jgi:hypothetical protein
VLDLAAGGKVLRRELALGKAATDVSARTAWPASTSWSMART